MMFLSSTLFFLLAGQTQVHAALQGGEVDVTGTWDLRVDSPQGTANPSIVLRQDGDRITGIYRGRMGETRFEGTLRRSTIRFSVVLKFQDQTFTVSYEGTVEGDTMQGSANFGDSGSGSWTGRRRR